MNYFDNLELFDSMAKSCGFADFLDLITKASKGEISEYDLRVAFERLAEDVKVETEFECKMEEYGI